ncbi:PREDICTED: protein NRT1/ PTR FAMILY 1.1-like [Nicotiana attenuata]|uniref:Protein nrt1 ptr family 1.2 n=1 Tax=Nicotiana attenuata TaxID=49451 RepID=A0A314KMU5_NICAT|nr:PREDICTED: protein NRT1/ PTR FAMILY 1.1-like [Nicotiana attenuata]XP_019228647.1 PREDICTED: protein NRT1/ PTR FAMILY 1.1-like [Nicotiana attenuata]XP_019228648.1 PREDICTED: protein NRT1/ PTR FAMILY 1.1-like [Nicotiana attenuata]OIT30608.1 protein nrt1 ptr family 1.2 [Nicotiana attenuata]
MEMKGSSSDLVETSGDVSNSKKGGLKTMPFIIANEALERAAGVGLSANMILYLTKEYHWENATGASILFWWGSIANFMPIFGALLADSYLGRYFVIALGTFVSLMGMVVLWLTAILKEAKPHSCNLEAGNCSKPDFGQVALLFASFALMSIGAGCIKPCALAFGADQFNKPENPDNGKILQSFFNWYYASVCISTLISMTVIVYIQAQFGWIVGFGVSACLMLLAAATFLLGAKLFIRIKANKSLVTSFVQVVAAAWKNKHLSLPPVDSDELYHHDKGSRLTIPTNKLRFLNKACIIRNPEKDLNPDGTASDPWKLCTVQQVEGMKALLKVLPIWSSGIMVAVTLNQHAFPVLQANTMDRHLVGNFNIPPGSFSAFAIITLTICVAIYDRILVPQMSKITKNPRGLSFKQRMGIGILLSCAAQAVAALVEKERRARALSDGLAIHPFSQVNMSAFWLIPQNNLTGLAEAFNIIGQIEFYYSQFPKSMASIGVALLALGMGLGNLVGNLIVKYASTRGGKQSWVSNNLNLGHYDYYYWLLCFLSMVNFFYFILCAWAYGSTEEQQKIWDVEQVEKEGDMLIL